jgi:hypothetical protein
VQFFLDIDRLYEGYQFRSILMVRVKLVDEAEDPASGQMERWRLVGHQLLVREFEVIEMSQSSRQNMEKGVGDEPRMATEP